MSQKNDLKCFGYLKGDEEKLVELEEVTFHGTPEALKAIATLILSTMSEAEKCSDKKLFHKHLQSEWNKWHSACPDVVVAIGDPNS